jgi:predicted nucleotidyltransferase
MDEIKNDIPNEVKTFFYNLSEYISLNLHFYGSIKRSDYIHGKSDIDIAIFTDNEYSTMSKLIHFLSVKKECFKKIVWKLQKTMIYGYKIKCNELNMNCEISIYNNKFKNILIKEFERTSRIPFFILWMLYILKFCFYKMKLMSSRTYNDLKRIIFNQILDKNDTKFLVI